ncbi:MAG: hypothetical protein AAF196_05050 [Planctomycetota bacterium]
MDAQDFLQQNKRFLMGALIGLGVFFVADYIVDEAFGGGDALQTASSRRRQIIRAEVYDRDSRDSAIQTRETFETETSRLRGSTVLVPGEDFTLDGKGDPEIFYPELAARVRRAVREQALEDGIEFEEEDLSWDPPVGRDEIERAVTTLCVLDHAVARLFDASRLVRQEHPEALGLLQIEKVTAKKSTSTSRGRRNRRRRDEGPIDVFDVQMRFRCGDRTLVEWLRRLESASPVLTIAPDLKVDRGDQLNDPVTVNVTVRGVLLRETTSEGRS